MRQRTFKTGDDHMANRSGISLAKLFGDISPKMRTMTVMTTVDTLTPEGPIRLTNRVVAREAAAILTILLPMSMVDSSWSYRSDKRSARRARLLPFDARFFNRMELREEKAVSVAEK